MRFALYPERHGGQAVVSGWTPGRTTPAFPVAGELPGAQTAERVQEGGLSITSRRAGTALEFGLALVDRLCGEAKEEEIARASMA